MASSKQQYTVVGTPLDLLDINIEYFDRSEINVLFNDVVSPVGTLWSWSGSSDKRILFTPAVAIGVTVTVKRVTDITKLRHSYTNGAAFTAKTLDEDLVQVLHIAQEATESNLSGDFFFDVDMHGFKINNLAGGTASSDAATFGQLTTKSAELAASTGSSLIGHSSGATGAVARTAQSKLRDTVSILDFSGIDLTGATSSSAGFQAALNSLAATGGTLELPNTYFIYLATSVTIPRNVTVRGKSESYAMPRGGYYQQHTSTSSIRLSNTATIILSGGASICNTLIINQNLVNALLVGGATGGFTSDANMVAAIAAYAGTAISASNSEDIYIHNCRILGFSQAIYTDLCDRQKIDFLDIDCTNGIWVNACYDIPRISNVHAWPFVAYGYPFSLATSGWVRTGSCFKTTTHFDAGVFLNCFSYGYAIGFDIQAPIETQMIGCYVDNNGSGANNGHIGYKISGATVAQISMLNCGASALDVGLLVDGSALKLSVTGCHFWGNKNHVLNSNAVNATYTACHFLYLNASFTPTYQLIVDGVGGQIDILDCLFYGSNVYNGIYAANFANTLKINNNNFEGSNVGITYATTMTGLSIITGNSFSAITPYTIPVGTGLNKAIIDNNLGLFSSQKYNYLTQSDYAFGGGSGTKHDNYYARGTAASPAISQLNDVPGTYRFYGHDGTGYKGVGALRGQVEDTPSAGSMSGMFIFSTSLNGTTSIIDRIKIGNAGDLTPITDNAQQLGVSGLRWSAIWAANGVIQTSDSRTKDNITPASLGLDFINKLNPVSYTWKQGGAEVISQVYRNADGVEVDSNTEGAIASEIITKERVGVRTHWGLIAQEVKQAADAAGVDFAGWVLTDVNDSDSQQALRYDQFISPLIKAVQELTARLTTLESKQS